MIMPFSVIFTPKTLLVIAVLSTTACVNLFSDTVVPDDPGLPNQWALDLIDASSAWESLRAHPPKRKIRVAVMDTGGRIGHEDIVWGQGINIDNPQLPVCDSLGHGTYIAGIMGALSNNGKGICGVYPGLEVIPVALGNQPTLERRLAGYRWCLENKIDVLNCSFTGTFDLNEYNAIADLRDAGCIVVAACGNNGKNVDLQSTPIRYPAAYDLDNILSVAACNPRGTLERRFSNYGVKNADIAAPGYALLTTSYHADSAYEYVSGTSYATPFVSAAVAMVWGQNPDSDYRAVIHHVCETGTEKEALRSKVRYGKYLNIGRALNPTGTPYPLMRDCPLNKPISYAATLPQKLLKPIKMGRGLAPIRCRLPFQIPQHLQNVDLSFAVVLEGPAPADLKITICTPERRELLLKDYAKTPGAPQHYNFTFSTLASQACPPDALTGTFSLGRSFPDFHQTDVHGLWEIIFYNRSPDFEGKILHATLNISKQ